jgi:hypothetical protein
MEEEVPLPLPPGSSGGTLEGERRDRYSYLSFFFPLGIFLFFIYFFTIFLKINSEFKICKSSLELSW